MHNFALHVLKIVKNMIRNILDTKVTEYDLNNQGSIPVKDKDLSSHHHVRI
jgi:hypothetical protein